MKKKQRNMPEKPVLPALMEHQHLQHLNSSKTIKPTNLKILSRSSERFSNFTEFSILNILQTVAKLRILTQQFVQRVPKMDAYWLCKHWGNPVWKLKSKSFSMVLSLLQHRNSLLYSQKQRPSNSSQWSS